MADLIFGLPGQDDAVWRQDVADVMASGVHGVDLYQLIAMAGTNLARAGKKGTLGWAADGPQRAAMYAHGAQTLEAGGWQRLSCSHWRRTPAERSRYNQMAKCGAEILPFGAGAGGSIHGHGLMQGRELATWHEALAEGKRPPGMVMGPNPDGRSVRYGPTVAGRQEPGAVACLQTGVGVGLRRCADGRLARALGGFEDQ